MIVVSLSDAISPFLAEINKNYATFIKRTFKALGWWVRDEVKKGMQSGHPGGRTFAPRGSYAFRKALSHTAPRAWYSRLKSAVAYEYLPNELLVGWVSPTASFVGRIQEGGIVRHVTNAMRKKFARAGYPLSWTTTNLTVPERPFYEPVSEALSPRYGQFVRARLRAYLDEAAVKSRRKYERVV